MRDAIHRGVAAADHDHVLAGGIERAGFELRHAVAETLAVAGDQIVERRDDVLGTGARRLQLARLVDAGRDQQRIVLLAQARRGWHRARSRSWS